MPTYSNVTLVSENGDLSVVVYLPRSLQNDKEETYYEGSRFDHGSMIGSITRRTQSGNVHVMYGTSMWRQPHNPYWPESGVGLSSEFGVGDNGAFCFFHCGWNQASDVTNGVLGYVEAKSGEPFLKIGVGALVKGTCPTCDSTGDYMFNSPYLFHEQPKWTMQTYGIGALQLQHEARLNDHGYHIFKEINLEGDTLSVKTSLTNLGTKPFSTAWYSHNFFTCDRNAVGPDYGLEMNLKGDHEPLYEEPGTWSWSTPLDQYAQVQKDPESVRVDMIRALEPGVRIKTEFVNDGQTDGSFQLNACRSTLHSSIPEMTQAIHHEGPPTNGDLSMYAYNLYIERGTISPEPQILMHLQPGATSTWTQRLVIRGDHSASEFPQTLRAAAGVPSHQLFFFPPTLVEVAFLSFIASLLVSLAWAQRAYSRRARRCQYDVIPNENNS